MRWEISVEPFIGEIEDLGILIKNKTNKTKTDEKQSIRQLNL